MGLEKARKEDEVSVRNMELKIRLLEQELAESVHI